MDSILEWALETGQLGKLFPKPADELCEKHEFSWAYFIDSYVSQLKVAPGQEDFFSIVQKTTPLDKQPHSIDLIWQILFPVWRSSKARNTKDEFLLVGILFNLAISFLVPPKPKGLGSSSKNSNLENQARDCRPQLAKAAEIIETIQKEYRDESWLPKAFNENLSKSLEALVYVFVSFQESVTNSSFSKHSYDRISDLLGKEMANIATKALINDLKECGFVLSPDIDSWYNRFRKAKKTPSYEGVSYKIEIGPLSKMIRSTIPGRRRK